MERSNEENYFENLSDKDQYNCNVDDVDSLPTAILDIRSEDEEDTTENYDDSVNILDESQKCSNPIHAEKVELSDEMMKPVEKQSEENRVEWLESNVICQSIDSLQLERERELSNDIKDNEKNICETQDWTVQSLSGREPYGLFNFSDGYRTTSLDENQDFKIDSYASASSNPSLAEDPNYRLDANSEVDADEHSLCPKSGDNLPCEALNFPSIDKTSNEVQTQPNNDYCIEDIKASGDRTEMNLDEEPMEIDVPNEGGDTVLHTNSRGLSKVDLNPVVILEDINALPYKPIHLFRYSSLNSLIRDGGKDIDDRGSHAACSPKTLTGKIVEPEPIAATSTESSEDLRVVYDANRRNLLPFSPDIPSVTSSILMGNDFMKRILKAVKLSPEGCTKSDIVGYLIQHSPKHQKVIRGQLTQRVELFLSKAKDVGILEKRRCRYMIPSKMRAQKKPEPSRTKKHLTKSTPNWHNQARTNNNKNQEFKSQNIAKKRAMKKIKQRNKCTQTNNQK